MRPFTAPISERSRQKYGTYQPRYKTESSMRAFTAPVSDYKREKYGEYEPRYVEKPSMKPFGGDINERYRELYGDFQPRYETESSMSAFDSELGSYKRDLYGAYRQRWETRKVGALAYSSSRHANGVNWVDAEPWTTGSLEPTIHDIAVYQVKLVMNGGWAGNAVWHMSINGEPVYPFVYYETVVSGDWVYLGTLSTAVKTGEHATIQFRSTNAGDVGPAQTMTTYVNYAEFQEI